MNPVFWLLVALILVFIWFALSPIFRKIGNLIFNKIDKTKKEMFNEKGEN